MSPVLLAMFGPVGAPELIIILIVVIIIFGVGRLPEVGGAVGKSIREFKKAMKEGQDTPIRGQKEEKKA